MRTHQFHTYFFALVFLVIFWSCNRSPGTDGNPSETASGHSESRTSVAVSGPAAEEQMRQAALDGELEKVKELLDAGTTVNAIDHEGHTALMLAAFNGHSGIVLALINGGASVDRRDLIGRTALLYASTGPFPETVKILLDKGAEPNIIDSNERFSP